MKFFHLSDLHIGLKLMNRDLREEQMDILRQVTDLAREEQPDAGRDCRGYLRQGRSGGRGSGSV